MEAGGVRVFKGAAGRASWSCSPSGALHPHPLPLPSPPPEDEEDVMKRGEQPKCCTLAVS